MTQVEATAYEMLSRSGLPADDLDPDLYNEDQLPTTVAERTWTWVSISA